MSIRMLVIGSVLIFGVFIAPLSVAYAQVAGADIEVSELPDVKLMPRDTGEEGFVSFGTDKPERFARNMRVRFERLVREDQSYTETDREQLQSAFALWERQQMYHLQFLCRFLYTFFPEDRVEYPDREEYCEALRRWNRISHETEFLTLERLAEGLWRPGYPARADACTSDEVLAEYRENLATLRAENEALREKNKELEAQVQKLAHENLLRAAVISEAARRMPELEIRKLEAKFRQED